VDTRLKLPDGRLFKVADGPFLLLAADNVNPPAGMVEPLGGGPDDWRPRKRQWFVRDRAGRPRYFPTEAEAEAFYEQLCGDPVEAPGVSVPTKPKRVKVPREVLREQVAARSRQFVLPAIARRPDDTAQRREAMVRQMAAQAEQAAAQAEQAAAQAEQAAIAARLQIMRENDEAAAILLLLS
jgi:hypothetical protein